MNNIHEYIDFKTAVQDIVILAAIGASIVIMIFAVVLFYREKQLAKNRHKKVKF
jgi:hypothetical protein